MTEGTITITTNVSGASVKVLSTTASGATIVATYSAVATSKSITTATLKNGTYEVVVSKDGYEDATKNVVVNGNVNVDITLVEKPIVASAISEITTNKATVVLATAPTKELTAADFKVTGNTVTKIEKGNFNTVYTLTLGTSLDNTKGTLTVNGASKDYDFTQLKINSVKAKNLRQLAVTFSKELDVTNSTLTDGKYVKDGLLNNLHIWMTKEEEGTTDTNSIKSIVGTNSGNWTAYVLSDKKTVIIESKDGSKLTDGANTGLGLKLNETYEVEALDVVDASGKYSDVSYMTDILKDTERPAVNKPADVTATFNANVVTSGKLDVTFTEPMNELKTSKAKVYIDGKDVTSDAKLTDVSAIGTVAEQSKISYDLTGLEKGEHTVAIVGAEDLNGNLISDNGKEYTFKITDPAENKDITPEVKEIKQIADNAFTIVFNTNNVVTKTTNNGVYAVIKNGGFDASGNGGKGEYKDIELKDVNKSSEDTITENGSTYTAWTFVLPATKDTVDTDTEKTLAYKGANIMNKDIEIKDFEVTGGKSGKGVTKTLTFKRDTTAPVVSKVEQSSASKSTIIVNFNDAPFADPAAQIALADSYNNSTDKVTVKYIDKDGVTYSEDVGAVLGDDKKSIKLQITETDMLDSKGELIPGGKYYIVLPDGVVTDVEEADTVTKVSGVKYQIVEDVHQFVGKTVECDVHGINVAPGNVPQTTKGMIFTGYEVSKATGSNTGNLVERVKNDNRITLKDNQIVVVFRGEEVDATTASNKDNYTLNGKVLPNGTTVEYRQADIVDDSNKEKFTLITLPENTIALTGGQDFTVQNVANKQGNKMMPVADVVTLSDNTAPVMKSITVESDNKIVITFSETIELTINEMTQLARNFVIIANGKTVGLSDAAADGKKLTITTADTFGGINVPVSVQIKKNSDGNIFITDTADNKAAEMTIKK